MLTNQTLALFKQKQPLFICIFSVLIFQLTLTFTVFYSLKDEENPLLNKLIKEYPFLKKNPITSFFLIPLLISCFLLGFISFIPSFPIKFFLFSIFAFFEGFLLTLARSTVSNETIMFGLLSTISIFGLMLFFSAILVNLNFDMLKYGLYLFFGMLILIIISLINVFFIQDDIVSNFIKFFFIILLSIYIIYDTYLILYRPTTFNNDCISGAISYYLDFINIFIRLADE
tara:strand:- start:4748 stop:5434 length:687 start_codon:yes stop_codon:yes gene_type:complete